MRSSLRDKRRFRQRWIAAAVILGIAALIFPLLSRLTHHTGETVILLMPPVFGTMLWFGWPHVRRIRWWKYVLYVVFIGGLISGAAVFASLVARGRPLPAEIFWAFYFCVGWRLAWTVWSRTVGRIGERDRRWGRRYLRLSRSEGFAIDRRRLHRARWTRLIGPLRIAATCLIFVPLFLGSLVHRIKIGNPDPQRDYAGWPLEEVSFVTDDGLRISGWYLPDRQSESTVIICHGAGANKGNFIDFLGVFYGQGYNSLIFDFRSHGESEGHTSTFGLYETADVKAAVDWLKRERPERARHVYALGSSMGAMGLVRAAAKDPRIEAVILDSCFASAPQLVHQHAARLPGVGRLFADAGLAAASLHAGRSLWELDAVEAVAEISPRPVLLIHGREDWLIPPVNMAILFDAAREPKDQWLGPGPHSNIMTTDFDGYQKRVIRFLKVASRPD